MSSPDHFEGLFGIAFLVFAMAFEQDKRNNPAERSATDARLGVARVVQLEEMNWGPAIPKSELGAVFVMRFRTTVSRRNKQGQSRRRRARPGRGQCRGRAPAHRQLPVWLPLRGWRAEVEARKKESSATEKK